MTEIQWFQVYEARFGKKLSAAEIEVWEEEFRREIRARQPGEITAGVRFLADEYRTDGKRKYAPTVNDIITAVIRMRYESRAGNEGGFDAHKVLAMVRDPATSREEFRIESQPARDWQGRLYASRDPVETWNIVCEPVDPDDCQARLAFCDRNNIPVERLVRA